MMNDAFSKLAPFIKDYIYRNNWESLRDIQVASCNVIFNSDDNLLLTSSTASGKTEAAFLPILTDIYNNPSSTVSILYISPLKALINDQFSRLNELLKEADLKVTKWHGDASQNRKDKIITEPNGIIQITQQKGEPLWQSLKSYTAAQHAATKVPSGTASVPPAARGTRWKKMSRCPHRRWATTAGNRWTCRIKYRNWKKWTPQLMSVIIPA